MRMKGPWNDERGAVLAIVALTLIALMGMVVLVIDVGGLLVMKRRLVTTADSAALAAAQQCAQNNGQTEALKAAGEVSKGNVDTSLGKVALTPSCEASSGEAFARYRAGQQLFFAPILGLGEDLTVSAPAKVIWGPADSGLAVPLMIAAIPFRDRCTIEFPPPASLQKGKKCGFYFDTDEIGTASWGWMSLEEWGFGASENCIGGNANELGDWIETSYPDPLALNWPSATYVCRSSGHNDTNWEDIRAIEGQVRIFPVNDPNGAISAASGGSGAHGQIDKNGNPCPPEATNNCTLHKYDIIGFTSFNIFKLYDGTDDEATGTEQINLDPLPCPGHPIQHTFTENDPPGPTFDITSLIEDCSTATGLVGTVVEPPTLPNKYKLDQDYTYDETSDVITWVVFPRSGEVKDVDITLFYDPPPTGGSAGYCGQFGRTPSGDLAKKVDKCLVLEWVGFSSAGSTPGDGPDFGLRAIRLVE